MATDSKHTKCKLEAQGTIFVREDSKGIIVGTCNSLFLANGEGEANAARIVECWNQHDQLKEENKILRDLLKQAIDQMERTSTTIKAMRVGRPGSYNEAAQESISAIYSFNLKANNILSLLSPSNTESNEKA